MAMVEDALSRPWRYHVTFRDIIFSDTSPDWFPYDQNIEFSTLILNTRIPGIARPLEPPRPRTSGTRITPTGTLGLFGTASEVQAQFHCKSFYVKFTWNDCFNKHHEKVGTVSVSIDVSWQKQSLELFIKGCVHYICASLFFKSKRKHLSK